MPGIFYWQEKVGKTNPHVLQCCFQITGAKTVSQIPMGQPVLTSFDAISAQSTIDDFLGTSSEFNYLAFDATSMGTDAFACIVDLNRQAASLVYAEAVLDDGTNVRRAVPAVATLTNTSLTSQAAAGSSGNLAARMILTGLDAATSGIVVVRFHFISK